MNEFLFLEQTKKQFAHSTMEESAKYLWSIPSMIEKGDMTLDDGLIVATEGLNYNQRLPSFLTRSVFGTLSGMSIAVLEQVISRFSSEGQDMRQPFGALLDVISNNKNEHIRLRATYAVEKLLKNAADFHPHGVVNALVRGITGSTQHQERSKTKMLLVLNNTLARMPEYKADAILSRLAEKYDTVSPNHLVFLPWEALVKKSAKISDSVLSYTYNHAENICAEQRRVPTLARRVSKAAAVRRCLGVVNKYNYDTFDIKPTAVFSRAIKTNPKGYVL